MSARIVAVVLVAGTYLLTLASLDPLDALLGLVLATGLVASLRGFLFAGDEDAPPRPSFLRRAAALVPFSLAVLWDITKGTWDVALVVLHLRPLARPGIVAVPIGRRTRSGVAATALVATLSPGEFLVDVDWERGVMLFHVLDARDPDAVRAHHERFYARWQEAVFP